MWVFGAERKGKWFHTFLYSISDLEGKEEEEEKEKKEKEDGRRRKRELSRMSFSGESPF